MHRRSFLLTCLGNVLAGALPTVAAEPLRLRVLSYNIHHGEGVDGKIDLERIARVIRDARPDLMALNEVDRGVRRTRQVDQPKELARLTGLHAVFERNIVYQDGDYGNAILTRWPVKRHKNHPLPSHYKGEQRGMLEVEVDLPNGNGPVLFLATHLDYRPGDQERQASARKIEELMADRPNTPAILAGDLNAVPESEVLRLFLRTWAPAGDGDKLLTYPSKEPIKRIDYVLYRPANAWRLVEASVIDEKVASDHRPVLAVLERTGR